MEQKIKEIIAVVFGLKSSEISEESSTETIENWDSLQHMNLIVAIEEGFDVEFEEEEIIELMSYQAICEMLKNKL